jgi:crossover junction endodeoxyribonuclease RuvC
VLILGLDPGSLHTGFGLIERRGPALRALAFGRFSPPSRLSLHLRLAQLAAELTAVLDRWQPEVAVLESLFHGVNSRSLIVLAQARGALLSVLAGRVLEVQEYSPAEVKQALTGNGRAGKDQVSRMVRLLLGLDPADWATDTADALAVAICCAQRLKMDRIASPV